MIYFDEYKIDGNPILLPDGDIGLTYTDLDAADAGRDESGVMHRIVVRERVKSWAFTYHALTRAEYRYMRSLFAGKARFTFTYPNEKGKAATCKAYCSTDSVTYFNAKLGLYKNFKFNVIQC